MSLQEEGILMTVRKHLNDAEDYLNSGAYDSARTSAEQAVAAARSQEHTPSLAAAYYGMASVLWNSGGSSEDAHRYASLAAQHTKANTTTDLMVRMLVARLKVARTNYDAAQVILDDLMNHYEREERDDGRADVFRSLGDMYLTQGRYELAKEKYFAALALYRKLEDPLNHAGLLVSLGGLMYQMGDAVEAVSYWQDARTIAEDNGFRHIVQAINRAMDVLKNE